MPRQYCTISSITDNMSLSILRVPHFLRLHTLRILFALWDNTLRRLQNQERTRPENHNSSLNLTHIPLPPFTQAVLDHWE
ncbi:hypothetical protein BLNAU_18307 [Blattamonas nauphoetae]|uniref:Uncharacterized protein n=1 Tax=Blattamonas nauphoetae TaxID=2049346 RepID=A0ABQ9X505_9EUKA|nr:hypothetical protein BLNAU_18307 [Blattamonas nauphoetae]